MAEYNYQFSSGLMLAVLLSAIRQAIETGDDIDAMLYIQWLDTYRKIHKLVVDHEKR